MNRFYICLVFLIAILIFCSFSLYKTGEINDEMHTLLDEIEQAVDSSNTLKAESIIQELDTYWTEHEKILVRFVRHSDIDLLTSTIKKLPYYLEFENYSELTAEINQIRATMEHVYQFERPTFSSIF